MAIQSFRLEPPSEKTLATPSSCKSPHCQNPFRAFRLTYALALGLALLLLSSCGGADQSVTADQAVTEVPPVTYAVSGTVSGLTTNGLVLANGADIVNLAPHATSFTFSRKLVSGEAYSVLVRDQPAERDQVCAVTAGSGSVSTAAVSTISVSCHSTSWVVSTVAGSGAAGAMDGAGTLASFNSPWGVAVDSAGNLYVADRGNNKIRQVSPDGVVATLAGSGAVAFADGFGRAASFNVPMGVAVDGSGTVYVADSTNCSIRKVSSIGLVSSLAGSPSSCGRITPIDGSGDQASFSNPAALTVTSGGTIFVADTANRIIRQVTAFGVVTSLAATAAAFPQPYGIASDGVGNIYYADNNSARIFRVAPNGAVTVFAGSGAIGYQDGLGSSATFTSPYGIAVDNYGNVYVSEGGSRIIRKISPNGKVVTIAGTPYVFGAADGVGSAASFEHPTGLAVDRAGNIYVSDNLNNNIRKIEPR